MCLRIQLSTPKSGFFQFIKSQNRLSPLCILCKAKVSDVFEILEIGGTDLLILSLPSAVELTMQLTPPCVSNARTGKLKFKRNHELFRSFLWSGFTSYIRFAMRIRKGDGWVLYRVYLGFSISLKILGYAPIYIQSSFCLPATVP
jgi:hypothetical protein